MSAPSPHTWPALHNAMWPGLVGKGPDSEPPIDLETMLSLTAATEVDGVRFDGVDLFLSLPHTDIDSSDDDLARLAGNLASKKLRAGSLVAPVWPPTGGGSALGNEEEGGRLSDAGQKSMPNRSEVACPRHTAGRHRAHRFRREPLGMGQRSRSEYQTNRADVPRSLHHRGRLWRTARRRGRDLLGGNA